MTRPLHHVSHGPSPPVGEDQTPWPEMMRMAAGFGVGPQAFWRLSLKEWRMLTARPEAVQPMGRGVLEQMAERWPDQRLGCLSPPHPVAARPPSPEGEREG